MWTYILVAFGAIIVGKYGTDRAGQGYTPRELRRDTYITCLRGFTSPVGSLVKAYLYVQYCNIY